MWQMWRPFGYDVAALVCWQRLRWTTPPRSDRFAHMHPLIEVSPAALRAVIEGARGGSGGRGWVGGQQPDSEGIKHPEVWVRIFISFRHVGR